MPEEMMSIPAARREATDVTGLFIVLAFVGMVALVGLSGLLCWWIFPRAAHPGLVPYPTPAYPPPQLQAAPHEDMVRFYRQELATLNSFGWVDRAKGIVHMPVDQAMRDVAREGIPDWPASAQGGAK
jgi:hypothetical protein